MSDQKRAAIYARVSSPEQIRGQSVEGQIERGRKHAADQGWRVVQVYQDPGFSAKTDDRPAFKQMLSDALSGAFDIIILESFDRFARNLEDAVTHKSLLRSHGVEIVSIMEPLDRDNPVSFIQEGLADMFAEYHSLLSGAKTKSGLRRSAERGNWPGRFAPLGYKKIFEKSGSWVDVSEAGADVKWAFEEFATGNYTLDQFVLIAQNRGIRSVSGLRLNKSDWHKIFTRKFYFGVMEWDGGEYVGNHEAIITEETYQAVQRVLARNNQGKKQLTRRKYLLGGLLWSDDADSRMIGTYGRSATGREYRYYRSDKRASDGRHTVPTADLEAQIVDALSLVTIPTEAIDELTLDDAAMALALRVAPNVGSLYPHLDTFEQRRALLEMAVARFHVSGNFIVNVEPIPPFSSDVWFELDSVLMPSARLEPQFYLWSTPCAV